MFNGLKRSADASAEPLSLADAKAYLRVDHDDENPLISSLIAAAREWCEHRARVAFLSQEWTATFKEFPTKGIELPRPPLIAVDSVSYRDEDGAWQVLASSAYEVDLFERPARLVLEDTAPTVGTHRDAWKVVYTAGYGESPSDLPRDLHAAIQLVTKALYEREEETGALHEAALRLLKRHEVPNPL